MQKIKCSHCKGLFIASRKGHKFCSENCRKLRHKARNSSLLKRGKYRKITEKLKKLVNSSFGNYLVRELKRAGTVQVLQGHTYSSLQELADLRRRCTASGGFDGGVAIWAYELSHIKPVQNNKQLGLLHPDNLVIATREFNRKLATKAPIHEGFGVAIDKSELIQEWNLAKGLSALEVLKLARKFLGKNFDEWLISYGVQVNQKSKLMTKLKKSGFEAKALKGKSYEELKSIDKNLDLDESEVSSWTFSTPPKDKYSSALEELNRFGLEGEIQSALTMVDAEEHSVFYPTQWHWQFVGTDYRSYVEALVLQSELLLHGQEYQETFMGTKFLDFWVNIPRPAVKDATCDDDMF